MATTNFKGQPVKLIGEFIQVGKVAPDFELVKTDLSSFSLKDLNGKNVILNIFPSLDTSVCATSVRKFNKMAAGLKDTVVLAISKDLPFAHGRFCTTEGIENVSVQPGEISNRALMHASDMMRVELDAQWQKFLSKSASDHDVTLDVDELNIPNEISRNDPLGCACSQNQ